MVKFQVVIEFYVSYFFDIVAYSSYEHSAFLLRFTCKTSFEVFSDFFTISQSYTYLSMEKCYIKNS